MTEPEPRWRTLTRLPADFRAERIRELSRGCVFADDYDDMGALAASLAATHPEAFTPELASLLGFAGAYAFMRVAEASVPRLHPATRRTLLELLDTPIAGELVRPFVERLRAAL